MRKKERFKFFAWLKRRKRLNQDIEDFWKLLQEDTNDTDDNEKTEVATYDRNKFYDL